MRFLVEMDFSKPNIAPVGPRYGVVLKDPEYAELVDLVIFKERNIAELFAREYQSNIDFLKNNSMMDKENLVNALKKLIKKYGYRIDDSMSIPPEYLEPNDKGKLVYPSYADKKEPVEIVKKLFL